MGAGFVIFAHPSRSTALVCPPSVSTVPSSEAPPWPIEAASTEKPRSVSTERSTLFSSVEALCSTHTALPSHTETKPPSLPLPVSSALKSPRDPQILDHADYILAEALLVRLGMARLVNAGIHRAAQMLYERAEKVGVNLPFLEVLYYRDFCIHICYYITIFLGKQHKKLKYMNFF